MNQDYICMFIGHEDEPIQGFCLNSDCQNKAQWCVKCFTDKHLQHQNDCKSFTSIKQLIKNYSNLISGWQNKVKEEFEKAQKSYKDVIKCLENENDKMIEFEKQLNEKKYKLFLENINHFKQWNTLSQTNIINDNLISQYIYS